MTGEFLEVEPYRDDDELFTHRLVCPVCHFECVHVKTIVERENDDDYVPGPNRGAQWVLSAWCENGHWFQIVFGFHKGFTFVGARQIEHAGLTSIPKELLK